MFLTKQQKNVIKWVFVLLIVGAIVYTFRDSAGPILAQLEKTTPTAIAGICAMSVGYQIVEGCITTRLAREYNPSFRCRTGVTCAFFCSFYRVATLGSGTGVAAIVYLGEQGLDYSQGFGMYMLQYAFHKMGIAVFSGLFFALNWQFMSGQFGDYFGLLVGGYALTALITAGLILFCCSARFHRLLFWILDAINAKTRGRFHTLSATLHEQCQMLEDASKKILRSGKLVAEIAALNLVRDAFWYGIPYLTFASTGAINLPETMAVTSLSVMLAAVIPTPAGIGSTEFVFSNLFASCVGSDLAVSASLLYRFATFVFPFLVGGVIVLVRRIRANKR